MKLVKTIRLVLPEAGADRIYEIDLCEVGAGQFVVNFRQGKRGAPLKDGTKTVAPVGEAEAERVFDRLVAQQEERGYAREGAPRPPAPRPAPPSTAPSTTAPAPAPRDLASPAQKEKILDRLASAAAKASVRPPARPASAPPAPAPPPAEEGIRGEIVSFSPQQGFGLVRLEGGQQMTFDVTVTEVVPGGLLAGVRVRVEIGPSRIPGRLVVKRLWAEGRARHTASQRPAAPAPPAPKTGGGPLERTIWRAGELRVREAEPALLALVGTGGAMRDYCIAWALGHVGTGASIDTLTRLSADPNAPPVKRIATLALQSVGGDPAKAQIAAPLVASLPDDLRAPLVAGDEEAFAAALRAHLAKVGPEGWGVVDLLYALDLPAARPAVIEQLRTVPLDVPYFYWLRHVFKAAEFRRDAEVFGLVAYRFEKTRANFSHENWAYRQSRGKLAPRAYGGHTRRYLRRRVWRTLRRAAAAGDADYVKLAVGVLLPFADADAASPRESYASTYDRWAPYWAFNAILYGKSPRYEPSPSGKVWRLARGVRIGAPAPAAREESFPALWDAQPAGLMHLLAESACEPVHEMAAKAIRASRPFLDALDVDDVIVLLDRPYEVTARLGLELAERRYDRASPSFPLLAGMARSIYAPARAKAFGWIDEQRAKVLGDAAFVADLVVSPHADAREYARRLLRSSAVAPDVGGPLVARVIAAMLALSGDAGDARARDATATLVLALAPHLDVVGPDVVRDLLSHPLSGVQELGAELLLRRDARAGAVPDEVMVAILHSRHENVRAVGMRLLAEMPEDVLAKMELLLVRLTTDKNADLRNASRPIVRRVATSHPIAGETIARALVEALLRRKLPEGAPSHVLTVLKEDLFFIVEVLPTADTWRLLQSASEHAQELGGLLLQKTPPERLSIEQIVKLASHDVLSVREAAWRALDLGVDRVRASMAEAAKVLDANWEDSRAFAFGYFRERLGPDAFNADVLVTILDSVREDVQAFGRELVTKYFRDEDGPVLMTKLSEHPTVAVQLFTTNYLARYATDRPETLDGLVPYFTSVLSRPNQGRVAKQRVLAFLEAEGKKSEEAARVVLAILHRVSATTTIELRAAAIAAMVAIHHAQPDVVVPLRFKEPPVRGERGVPVRV